MTIESLEIEKRYQEGFYTESETQLRIVELVNRGSVEELLCCLSEETLDLIKQYMDEYFPGQRVIRGNQPTDEQIRLTKEWLRKNTNWDSNK